MKGDPSVARSINKNICISVQQLLPFKSGSCTNPSTLNPRVIIQRKTPLLQIKSHSLPTSVNEWQLPEAWDGCARERLQLFVSTKGRVYSLLAEYSVVFRSGQETVMVTVLFIGIYGLCFVSRGM